MGDGNEFVLFLLESGFDVRQLDGSTDFGLELVDLCAVCLQTNDLKVIAEVWTLSGKTNQSAKPSAK